MYPGNPIRAGAAPRQPAEPASSVATYWLRLTPSSRACRASSACSPRGIRTTKRPLAGDTSLILSAILHDVDAGNLRGVLERDLLHLRVDRRARSGEDG